MVQTPVPTTPRPTPVPTPPPSPVPSPRPSPQPTPGPTLAPTPRPSFTPTENCSAYLTQCVDSDECCSGLECRRISATPEDPWVCRPAPNQNRDKLPRAGYCIGGIIGTGCRRRTTGGMLRGEHARHLELAEPSDVTSENKNQAREQSPEEQEALPEA